MATIYLDRRNLALCVDESRLCIHSPEGGSQSVPLSHVDRVIVLAHTLIDSRVLSSLAEQGSVLSVISRRDPALVATVGRAAQPSADRRVAQYLAYSLPETRFTIARTLLRHKLRTQSALLRKTAAIRPDARHRLLKSARQIDEAREALVTASAESLLGLEGSSSAAYFAAYTSLFAPSLGFTARNRRPPRDPVNVCLSLGYTLLHVEAVRAAGLASLDPYIGFLHELHHGRESLACDLVELERSRVDEWLYYAFRDRVLRGEHFRRGETACLLGKAGRRAYYGAFQPVLEAASRRLRHWAQALVRFLNTNSREHLFDSREHLFAEPVSDSEHTGQPEA
jgi:CRISPR-associated protein Cas1